MDIRLVYQCWSELRLSWSTLLQQISDADEEYYASVSMILDKL